MTERQEIAGGAGNDILIGDGGNNLLYGRGGDDTLDGGAGDDILDGGSGNNTYLFGRGDGQDTLVGGTDFLPNRLNTLQFKGGISPGDIIASALGDSLILKIAGTNDQLTIQSFLSLGTAQNGFNPLQQVRFADGTVWNLAAIQAKLFDGTADKDVLIGTTGSDTIHGGAGNDTLVGRDGNDTLLGGADDDSLYGEHGDDILDAGAGNDVLNGGAGNDTLNGGTGSNTYIFGRGDGQDTLVGGNDSTTGRVNTLQFKENIAPADIIISTTLNSLTFKIAGTSDQMTIESFLLYKGNPLQQVRFADGTVWDLAAIRGTFEGTASKDVVFGGTGNDVISGLGGDDIIYGRHGNDKLMGGDGADALYGADGHDLLEGGAGDDELYGEAGDDTLDGGAGSDELNGGSGNNTYLFGRGDGQDTLVSAPGTDTAGSRVNTLQFKAGVSPADVIASISGGSLVLKIAGTDDQVTVRAFLSQNTVENVCNPLQQVRFADGTIWTAREIVDRQLIGTEADDVIIGTADANVIIGNGGNDFLSAKEGDDLVYGGAGDDIIYGAEGDDTLGGGDGNDRLHGGSGNDTLDGGKGNDFLNGGSGNNLYLFGRGDGQDTLVGPTDDTAGRLNTLQFKEGISADDVMYSVSGASLIIKIAGTNDQVTVQNFQSHFGLERSPLQQVRFADGTTWSAQDIIERRLTGSQAGDDIVAPVNAATLMRTGGSGFDTDGRVLLDSQVQGLVDAMAAFSPPAAGETALSSTYQGTLNLALAANWH